MGDFLLLWPVASWYYKNKGQKIHFVITKNYFMHEKMVPLLEYQPFTEKVTLVDIPPDIHVFNPANYGVTGEYMNFGFYAHAHNYKGKWTPFYYADLYQLGVDMDYRVSYPKEDVSKHERVWVETTPDKKLLYQTIPQRIPQPANQLSFNDPLITNINLAVNAGEVWTNGGGFTILMEFVDKPCTILTNGKDPWMQFIRANAYPNHPIQHKWIML